MPKNIITEPVNISTNQEVKVSNTVFIPIQTTVDIEATLCTTETELKNNFEASLDESGSLEYSPLLGYNLCKHLLKNGLTVLVQGVTSSGSTQVGTPELAIDTTTLTITPTVTDPVTTPDTYLVSFIGWDAEGGIVYPETKFTLRSVTCDLAEYINKKGTYIISVVAVQNGFLNSEIASTTLTLAEDISPVDINTAIADNAATTKLIAQSTTATINWEALKDKNLYDIRFLTTGALKVDVSQDMIDCAEYRGDCTALINFDESSPGYSYVIADIKAEVAEIDNGQYAAAFTPAFYTEHANFTADEEVLIPAAFGYLFAYARSIKSNPEWFAVAGFNGGVIPELSRVKYNYSTAEVNALQNRTNDINDNVGIAINAIAYIRPAGIIIYGNRTLKDNETSALTATSFLNVRNMISIVKKVAYEAANRFTFEQNSDILFINYKSYIVPTLDRITSGNGALGYTINKIKTTERAKLKAEIIIEPIEAVEDIELSVIMTDADTVVNE